MTEADNYSFSAVIKADLSANSFRHGIIGVLVAWFFSPSFRTVFRHRLVTYLFSQGFAGRLVGRLLWHHGVRVSACHIHWKAKIGPGLALPHPTGIVIGEGVRIGNGATIYQQVTIGTNRKQGVHYPNVGNDVIIYAGAALFGNIKIGDDTVIGSNVIVASDVPPKAKLKHRCLCEVL